MNTRPLVHQRRTSSSQARHDVTAFNSLPAILTILLALVLSRSAWGVVPVTVSCGSADVDGQISEWDLTTDFLADMYHSADMDREVYSKLYARYDYNQGVLYVLSLQSGSAPMDTKKSEEAWVKIDDAKVVDDTYGDNGVPPDFAWYDLGYAGPKTARGWEASFYLAPGSYVIGAHNNMIFGGESQTVGIPPDGEYFTVGCKDLGDLPDATAGVSTGDYQTLLDNYGPSHILGTGLLLGESVDAELDGQPDPQALGDDDDAGGTIPDDEDGVGFPTLTAGETAELQVVVANAPPGGAKLNAFFDWNNNGLLDETGEAFAFDVSNGDQQLSIPVPLGAVTGVPLGVRFRLSTAGGLSPYGEAADGEVEDYLVTIEPFVPPDPAVDWGDLPDSGASPSTGTGNYQTLGIDAGPNHTLATDVASRLRMGAAVDGELDGQPNGTATGDDDALLPDDEDGVSGLVFEVGKTTTVVVTVANAGGGAKLNAFFDWNNDGKFDGTGETITELAVLDGPNNLSVPVPIGAVPNTLLGARFRISTAGGLGPTGNAVDGEVEDYLVTVTASPTAATLAYFRARVTGPETVSVQWGTLVEFDVLGFRVERATGSAAWQRATEGVVPATGSNLQPQTYVVQDGGPGAVPGSRYRLIELDLAGQPRVVAETIAEAALATGVKQDAHGLSIEVRGNALGRVVVETSVEAGGPWSAVEVLRLDAAGSGIIRLQANSSEPARFYRVSTE